MPKAEYHAVDAAREAFELVLECISEKKSFRVEAGAGAGKTYTLIHALRHLISTTGVDLIREDKQIVCITYTNVAADEISSRIDQHPAVAVSTIHAWCWSLIRDFQSDLKREVLLIPKLKEKIDEAGGLLDRYVTYDRGYQSVRERAVYLSHDDVLGLFRVLLGSKKFQRMLVSRYPVIFIDEYQDTDSDLMQSIITNLIETDFPILIGLFGDHWQKIYDTGCGLVNHPKLEVIEQKSNFRSAEAIVNALNMMRPELPQVPSGANARGFVRVYHTNDLGEARMDRQPWTGDLPRNVAHAYLESVRAQLSNEGWEINPDQTKILMLTHGVLSEELGYAELAKVFKHKESFTKKEDPYIEFFIDVLEPAVKAFIHNRHGEMLGFLGAKINVGSQADKERWQHVMTDIVGLRESGTIGEVLSYIRQELLLVLSNPVRRRDEQLQSLTPEEIAASSRLSSSAALMAIPYSQVIPLAEFIAKHTLFSTKHGVKGAEFENVIVVVGKGWSKYNFARMLEFMQDGVPHDKQDSYERSRNLFYVTCSRARLRLALLFTESLSETALSKLETIFGAGVVQQAPSRS